MVYKGNSFLELNWLAKSDKDILLPIVLFIDNYHAAGEFFSPDPGNEEIIYDAYPLDRGIIIVNTNEAISATLAHEWRHAWQHHRGIEYDGVGLNKYASLSYEQQIIKYFKSSRCEMDALLFEVKKSPDEYNLEWHEWVIKNV